VAGLPAPTSRTPSALDRPAIFLYPQTVPAKLFAVERRDCRTRFVAFHFHFSETAAFPGEYVLCDLYVEDLAMMLKNFGQLRI